MSSIAWLSALSYLSFAVLIVGVGWKVIKYMNMPIHLRWELYPIPHEKKDGSYFEEVDWWKKPRHKHYLNQAFFMAQEILFIRALYHHNRKMWYASFPFHFGLYLVLGWLALLVGGAALTAFGAPAGAVNGIQMAAKVVGVIGLTLGAIGSLGLLLIRATAEELKNYTAPVDYFNLFFILAVMGTGILSWLTVDPDFVVARTYIQSLITFKAIQVPGPVFAVHIILFSLFFLYLPFTHMTHFVMKYFMWDKVRFEDEPNFRGSAVERKVAAALTYTQTWSAPHMHSGTKWSETASKGVK